MPTQRLIVCIPTYKRTALLERLLKDISSQTVRPQVVVIVDGDPDSGSVKQVLLSSSIPSTWQVLYVPSNHSNLAYQRYLGWRVARKTECDVLLYFDDDLRLLQQDTIEKILDPFTGDGGDVVGVTAPSHTGDLGKFNETEALRDHSTLLTQLARAFGSFNKTRPGGLTPVGHRRWPAIDERNPYAPVEWLQGRIMAYRMEALAQSCFSEDLFALTHIHCGLGEDTFLSRQVGTKGQMLMALNAQVEHPDDDTPKAYPYQAQKLAYATAYSRRFLNDHYRSPHPPTMADRLALVRNYLGVTTIAWLRAIASFKAYRYAYAWGYTLGSVRGLLQKPTAKNLTPDIDWWADAEEALAQARVLQPGETHRAD